MKKELNYRGEWKCPFSLFIPKKQGGKFMTEQYHKIIAYVEVNGLSDPIKAKFFYQNNKVFYEVTKELFEAIHKYNIYAQSYVKRGKYRLFFPFKYEEHYITYPNGFGDTHFFVEHEFDRIDKYMRSFPLRKCDFEVVRVNDIESVKLNKKQLLVLYSKEKAT